MKPYPSYKPTGLAWLPSVPEHWEIRKLRQVLSQTSEKNHADKPLLSVVREKGVILRDTENKEENHNFIPDDLSNYKLVRKYQFAMNKMKAWQGSYGVSQHEGIVSPAYFVFDLHGVSCDFFHVAIRSAKYVDYFAQASDGIRVGQWDLSIPRMKEIPFVVPPPSEQDRIVRYLDEKTTAIDELVRAKERQIELLRERKQALVSDAVTGGLDPATERKDSGVPWIGKIPKEWKIRRGKFLYRIVNGFPFPSERFSVTKGYPLIRIRDITSGRCETFFDGDFVPEAAVGNGDLLVGMDGEFGVRLWQGGDALLNQRCCMVKEFSLITRRFLFYVLPLALKDINDKAYSTTVKHLSSPDLLHLSLPLPPRPEQERIVAHLDSVCSELDAAEAAIRKQITLLQELRTRLVSDAVTGAVEVS